MKIVRVHVERLFHVTYNDGTTEIIKDTDLSEKPLTLRQYFYLLMFSDRNVEKALDDCNRSK